MSAVKSDINNISNLLKSEKKISIDSPINGRYDVCFVFPVESKENPCFKAESVSVMGLLTSYFGIENFFIYLNDTKDEIYVLLRISDNVLKKYAADNEVFMHADEKATEERGNIGWPDDSPQIKPLKFEIEKLYYIQLNITNIKPYECIYLKYRPGSDYEALYKKIKPNELFDQTLRIKIIKNIVEGQAEFGYLELNPIKLISSRTLTSTFALHDEGQLDELKKEWFSTWEYFLPFQQPLQAISNYFGEEIALYFGYVEHFSTFLTIPAVVGLGAELVVAAYSNIDHPVAAFYSVFIVLWAVFLSEFWKRREKFIALAHGMLHFESEESYRVEFKEEVIVILAGREVLFFPPNKRLLLTFYSYVYVGLLCFTVIGTTAAIYKFRFQMASTNQILNETASTIASILNAVQVQVYGLIYSYMKNYLTDLENHRTVTGYEDSMIYKSFVFAFINSYASFFYLAFFAGDLPVSTYPGQPADDPKLQYQGQCGYQTCMEALAINLGIVLTSSIIVSIISEVLIPYLSYRNSIREEDKRAKEIDSTRAVSPAEKQNLQPVYGSQELIADYLQILVLFGYMTMFVSALPGSSFVVWFALWFQIRTDSFKILHFFRRPFPSGAQDIGTWQDIMDLVIVAAVITNAALIVFTMKMATMYSISTQYWLFIGFQWVVFSIQYCIRILIPDTPMEIEIQQNRNNYINSKLIDKTQDVEDFASKSLQMNTLNDETVAILNGLIYKPDFSVNKSTPPIAGQPSDVIAQAGRNSVVVGSNTL